MGHASISSSLTTPFVYAVNGFGSDGSNFIYFNSASDYAKINTNGVERMRITSVGDVGIGTDTPTTPLHVKYAAAQDSFEVGIKVENTVGDSKLRIEGTNDDTAPTWGRAGAGIDLRNLDTTAGNYSNINFYNGAGYAFAGIFGVCTVTGASDYTEGKLGFYTRNATDNYRLSMTLDESGRLGIGSASPAALLDVDGTATFDEVGIGTADPSATLTIETNTASPSPTTDSHCGLLIENTDSAGAAILRMRGGDGAAKLMYGENNSTDKLYISPRNSTATQVVVDHIGRMGIGADTPAYKLDVKQDSETYAARIFNDGNDQNRDVLLLQGGLDAYLGNTKFITFADGNGTETAWIQGATNNTSGGLAINTTAANATDFVVDESGNVGIGTDAPVGNVNALATVVAVGGDNTNIPELKAGGSSAEISIAGGSTASYLWSKGAYPLIIATNGSEKMRITSAGDVGIGTTSPEEALDVKGNIALDRTTTGKLILGCAGELWGAAGL